MAKTIDFVVTNASAGQRLDRVVAQLARDAGVELSNRQAKTLVEEGAVRLRGKIVRHASHRVTAGDAVVVVVAVDSVTRVTERADLRDFVIYRDDVLLAINKPSGLPTHATHDPDRDHAHAAVGRILGEGAYVAVHHRLDVETSGVLVFAIDKSANKGLADAFAERSAQKRYLAVVAQPDLPDSFEVENHLGRNRHDTHRMIAVNSGGDAALTAFETVARSTRGALVAARPHTGRTHQIRVHLQGFGASIVGDVLYDGASAQRLMLHAQRLVLPHPTTGEILELAAAVPADFRDIARDYDLEIE